MSYRRASAQMPLIDAELAAEAGELRIAKADYYALLGRFTTLEVCVLLFFECKTRSALKLYNLATGKFDGPRPAFARPAPGEMPARFRRSQRTLDAACRRIEEQECVEREFPDSKTHRGGYRILPENYAKVQLKPMPVKKERKKRVLTAAERVPSVLAALRVQQPTAEEANKERNIQRCFAKSPSESAIRTTLIEAKLGRIVQQSIAERGSLPTMAEIEYVQELAKKEAAQAVAEYKAVVAVAEPAQAQTLAQSAGAESRVGLPNLPSPLAVITPPAGATSATCCPYKWPCPVFDSHLAQPSAATSTTASGPSPSDTTRDGVLTVVASDPPTAPLPPHPDAEALAVWEAMKPAGGTPDEHVAQLVINACRKKMPEATLDDILWAVGERAVTAKRKTNPPGYMLTVVPKLFPHAARAHRRDLEREAEAERLKLDRKAQDLAESRKQQAAEELQRTAAQQKFDDLPEAERERLIQEKYKVLKASGRAGRISAEVRREEAIQMVLRDMLDSPQDAPAPQAGPMQPPTPPEAPAAAPAQRETVARKSPPAESGDDDHLIRMLADRKKMS